MIGSISDTYTLVGRNFFQNDQFEPCLRYFAASCLLEEETSIKPQKPPKKTELLKSLKKKMSDEDHFDKSVFITKLLEFTKTAKTEHENWYLESLYSVTNFNAVWKIFLASRLWVEKSKNMTKKERLALKVEEPNPKDIKEMYIQALNYCDNAVTNAYARQANLHEVCGDKVIPWYITTRPEEFKIENEKMIVKMKKKKTEVTYEIKDDHLNFAKKLSILYCWKCMVLENKIDGLGMKEFRKDQRTWIDYALKSDPENKLAKNLNGYSLYLEKKFREAFLAFDPDTPYSNLLAAYVQLLACWPELKGDKTELLKALKCYEAGKSCLDSLSTSGFATFKFKPPVLKQVIEEMFCYYNQVEEMTEFKYYNKCFDVIKLCRGCGKDENTSACTACKCVYYCSKECQKDDWPTHKKLCKK
jgi:hypothetical protein